MYDKDLILKTREKYLEFIADWPEKAIFKGRNIKQLFTDQGDLSLWWLSQMQMKDTEASDLFKELYLIEKEGIATRDKAKRSRPLISFIFQRVRYALYLLIKITAFKIFIRPDRDQNAGAVIDLLFFSIYGSTLQKKENGSLSDRYYLDLPEEIGRRLRANVKYLALYSSSLRKLIAERGSLKTDQIIFIEKYLSMKDIISAFDVFSLIRYIRLEKHAAFRRSFMFNGHDAYDLFRPELRISFLGPDTMKNVLIAKAVEKIAKKYKVKGVVNFHEMYPISRAVYYGAKKGFPEVKTFAYQHANITPLKLWYAFSPKEMGVDGDNVKAMPIPDHFIFQGKMGRDILLKSGYPEERSMLTGSPRFDGLAEIKPQSLKTSLPIGKKIILVATTYLRSDTEAIVKMTGDAAKQLKDYLFIFKAHPNCPVDKMINDHPAGNCIVVDDDVQQLILHSDLLVTSYSITADEAIAMGKPAICIDTGVALNMSSFFDLEAAPIVDSVQSLISAVDMTLNDPIAYKKYRDNWARLIEATFFRIDGRAKDRVVQVFQDIISPKQGG